MVIKAVFMLAIVAMALLLGLSSGKRISCDLIQENEFECATDNECSCSGKKWLICKRTRCVPMTIKDFMERQPCFGVFKTNCTTDSDCSCDGIKLMCEDNECVREKLVYAY